MRYNIFTADKIEVGGEIYFDDVYSGKFLTQSNYDEYWSVHGKNGDMILVKLRDNYWSVNVKDVRAYIPPAKQEKPQQI